MQAGPSMDVRRGPLHSASGGWMESPQGDSVSRSEPRKPMKKVSIGASHLIHSERAGPGAAGASGQRPRTSDGVPIHRSDQRQRISRRRS